MAKNSAVAVCCVDVGEDSEDFVWPENIAGLQPDTKTNSDRQIKAARHEFRYDN
jgi:hypothetical protein